MKNPRKRFELFCMKHRNVGIPNLMLFLCVGSAIVYLISNFAGNYTLYNILCFDRASILQGQVWRLISYPLTAGMGSSIFSALIAFVCYYSLGRAMENTWGTLRFNLFYLSGVVLMDIFGMLTGVSASVSYLNLSLFLAYATTYRDAQFLLLFIIPIKAWIFALAYLGIILYEFISMTVRGLFPYSLYPLISLANYFLFFGKDVVNVFPISWRNFFSRLFKKKPKKAKVMPFTPSGSYKTTAAKPAEPFNHRCTVCGRTDISDPELEFRYCSRCNGYRCYCSDHINNHQHVQ